MLNARIVARVTEAIVFSLVITVTLWAQYNGDSGQFQILSARYGTEKHNIDVTQRLKELARRDRTFRMGNSTFGADPDPGRVKSLRIYARGPNGNERMFEYQEGSMVDGSMFTGWSGGNWGQGGWNGGWGGNGGSGGDYPGYDPGRHGSGYRLSNSRPAQRDFGGGSGGRNVRDAKCGSNEVATGFHVQMGQYFNLVWVDCANLRPNGSLDNNARRSSQAGSQGGAERRDAQCRGDQAMIGLRGRTGASIDEAAGQCADPRDIADRRGYPRTQYTDSITILNPGGRPAQAQCQSGQVMVGIRVKSAEWIDHMWILCSDIQRGR